MKPSIVAIAMCFELMLQGCNTVFFPKQENSMALEPETTSVNFYDVKIIPGRNISEYPLAKLPVNNIAIGCKQQKSMIWPALAAAAVGVGMDQIKKAFDQEAASHQASFLAKSTNAQVDHGGVSLFSLKENPVLLFSRFVDGKEASRFAILLVECQGDKSEAADIVGIPLYYDMAKSKAKLPKRNWWVAWFPLFWYQLFIEENDKLKVGVTLSVDGKSDFVELQNIHVPKTSGKKSCYKNAVADWDKSDQKSFEECETTSDIPSDKVFLLKGFGNPDAPHSISALIMESDTSNAKDIYTSTSNIVVVVKDPVKTEVEAVVNKKTK